MSAAEISLRVPGKREYALVIRTALGGVAVLRDLNVDALDDLRAAADEACDCLLHQGRPVETLSVDVYDEKDSLTVTLAAEFIGDHCMEPCEDITPISQAVLETLIPHVKLTQCECGCVQRIDLTLNKAV